MPPKIKTSRENIMSVAIEMVRDKGWESINARDIARLLDCSTQPIFREVENMAGSIKIACIVLLNLLC